MRAVILSPKVNGNDFTFSFETISNMTYVIECRDSLNDASWQTLQSISGDGNPTTVTNSVPDALQRFFRLRVEF